MPKDQNVSAAVALDDIDEKIVALLRVDGRLSVPQLAERVGVSRATAYARFDRLVDSGVIQGFEARVAPAAVGLPVGALITLSAEQVEWADMHDRLTSIDSVQWVGLTAGSSDFVVLVRARSLDDLRDVVLRELLLVPGIRNTETAVLLDESRRPGAAL
ncbi:MAG: Lrp/AsnC family transcriptional regulator [Actinomycetota bacterium]